MFWKNEECLGWQYCDHNSSSLRTFTSELQVRHWRNKSSCNLQMLILWLNYWTMKTPFIVSRRFHMDVGWTDFTWMWVELISHGCGLNWFHMDVGWTDFTWMWVELISHGCGLNWFHMDVGWTYFHMDVGWTDFTWMWVELISHGCGLNWFHMDVDWTDFTWMWVELISHGCGLNWFHMDVGWTDCPGCLRKGLCIKILMVC